MKILPLAAILVLTAQPALAGTDDPEQTETWQARAVVEQYYQAIDAKDYETAYRFWGNDGQSSGQSLSEFEKGFAETASVAVFTGPVEDGIEGAAGSLYATVPVRVESQLENGKTQHFAGKYVISRANEVPGATPEQLEWHIYSADIEPAE